MKRILLTLSTATILATSCQQSYSQQFPSEAGLPRVASSPYHWRSVAIGGGGYVTGLIIHPKVADLVYIRTDVGGIYRWNPAGKSWIPLMESIGFDESNLYGVDGLAVDASNPNVVYVTAGKYEYAQPHDVLKSQDQGRTWKRTGLNKAFGGNKGNRMAGERIAVDPSDGRVVLAGTFKDGLWISRDGAASWSQAALPSEADGKRVNTIFFDSGSVRDGKTQTIYAGVANAGVFVSTDGGTTWKNAGGGPGNPNRIAQGADGALYVSAEKGLFKLAGEQWREISPEKGATYNAITTHPTDPNIIATARYWGGFHNTMSLSPNGGTTWKTISSGVKQHHSVPWAPAEHFGAAISALEFDPHQPQRLWMTDWYATWINPDWRENNWYTHEKGHEEIVAFDLKSPPEGAPLLSGIADVSGLRHTNLDEFPLVGFGGSRKTASRDYQDTISLDFAESDPNFFVRVGGRRPGASYSTDNGQTWTEFAQKPGEGGRIAVSADGKRIVWMPGKSEAFVSSDRGATWQKTEGGPTNPVSGLWDWRQPLAADRVDPNRFYVYRDGQFYRSGNGGLNWTRGADLPRSNQFTIKAAPGIGGEVWAALDEKGLHRSSDGGASFSKVSGVERAYLFAFGKPAPGRNFPTAFVYGRVSGQNGIFRSDDAGANWTRINDDANQVGNSPNSMEGDRQVYGRVYIGTNGRGIYYGEPAMR